MRVCDKWILTTSTNSVPGVLTPISGFLQPILTTWRNYAWTMVDLKCLEMLQLHDWDYGG